MSRRGAAKRMQIAALVSMALTGLPPAARSAGVEVTDLRFSSRVDPLGVDDRAPLFGWRLESARRGVAQSAYQLQVAKSQAHLLEGVDLLWDSGPVEKDDSQHRPYLGPPLVSRQRYWWRVRVWDETGEASGWSAPACWEMGLLEASDWSARWIQPALEEAEDGPHPPALLRRELIVGGAVRRARLYVTSLGLYEVEINGHRVGADLFTPGWTSYASRLQVQTYDVTELLVAGSNAVGVTLADGWYRGNLGFSGQRNVYGRRVALLLQLEVEREDGETELLVSDDGWKAATGPIQWSDLYDGERYDARLERPGWSAIGYDDGDWASVEVRPAPPASLVAPIAPPVRRTLEVRPRAILHTPRGETVVDMGQNLVGWVRLRADGEAGTTVTLRHAEILDAAGNLYTENLRQADQRVEYVLKGGGEEVFEPHFTFQGFRYVGVEGYPGEPTLESLTGVVVHSDLRRTGEIETSDPDLNRLLANIVWSQRGNFLEVPTDCPQRDERLGWTGDAQVFAPTAAFNMDVELFFAKWLHDLAADQVASGAVPWVVPNVLGELAVGAAGWGDAAVVVPWTMYAAYGSKRLLREQYESMKAWVDYEERQAGEDLVWRNGTRFGDWLEPRLDHGTDPRGATSPDMLATAYLARSAGLVAGAAAALGEDRDAQRLRFLEERVRVAFQKAFWSSDEGRLSSDTQTAYVLALAFDLLPVAARPAAVRRLAELVRERDTHLTTGFLGTPWILHVLSRFGELDLAYELLLQRSFPSWLYPVTRGATTIWERWDGIRPDGRLQTPGMNSFNHYAFGAVGDWVVRAIGGLEPQSPGYRTFTVSPQPGGGLGWAKMSFETRYGRVESAWVVAGEELTLEVVVPANTSATIRLPESRIDDVRESGRPLRQMDGLVTAVQSGDAVVAHVGSGRYRFVRHNRAEP